MILRLVLTLNMFIPAYAAFSQEMILDEITSAIATGNSKTIASHCSKQIYFTWDRGVQRYSKTQAEYVLQEFFKQNPTSDFSILHHGESNGGLKYAVGEFLSGDHLYRILIRIKDIGGHKLIQEIAIIPEET